MSAKQSFASALPKHSLRSKRPEMDKNTLISTISTISIASQGSKQKHTKLDPWVLEIVKGRMATLRLRWIAWQI